MPRIAKVFLYLIYIVIVGGLITAIGLTFHHDKVSSPGIIAKQQTLQTKKQSSVSRTSTKVKNPSATLPSSTASSSPSPTPTIPNTTSSQSSTATNGSTSALSNTGPGNTIALFVIVSLLSVIGYRQLLIRRLF